MYEAIVTFATMAKDGEGQPLSYMKVYRVKFEDEKDFQGWLFSGPSVGVSGLKAGIKGGE
jgi:hypothetical protein